MGAMAVENSQEKPTMHQVDLRNLDMQLQNVKGLCPKILVMLCGGYVSSWGECKVLAVLLEYKRKL